MYVKGEAGREKDPARGLALYQRGCNIGSSVACDNRNALRAKAEREAKAATFRTGLATGSESHCGLVVEVKAPIAKIQTMIGERWLKIEQLFPAGQQSCRFVNGVYQEP